MRVGRGEELLVVGESGGGAGGGGEKSRDVGEDVMMVVASAGKWRSW